MNKLTMEAPAKINLGLDVLRRRPDGYHDLRMVMQTISLKDELVLTKTEEPGIFLTVERECEEENRPPYAATGTGEGTQPDGSGASAGETIARAESAFEELPADNKNLAHRAAELLLREFPQPGGVRIALKKRIPIAAGLAGGSTDAAATLLGMNRLFDLGLSLPELQKRGVTLGADIPYCLMKGTALAEGIGERLTPLPKAPACHVLLAKPDVSVSTAWVYQNLHLTEDTVHPDIDEMTRCLAEGNLTKLCACLGNVLETVTIPAHPVIARIKAQMREAGALGALMSGSGPTVFGLFDSREKAEDCRRAILENNLANELFVTEFEQEECMGKDGTA